MTAGTLALNIPWKEGKWSNLKFKGLQDGRLLSFSNRDGPDVVAAVTDADIDTDGPGGSKSRDRFWSPNTSLRHPGGAACDSRQFRGGGYATRPAAKIWHCHRRPCLGHPRRQSIRAQVYDSGPEDKIGEISFGLAVDLKLYDNRDEATERNAALTATMKKIW